MLGNVVHLPNWNMTLSQKLSNCPKFTAFVHEFLSPFHSLHLKLLFEAIMNWEYRFWSVLWAATPQSILPLPWPLFLALPSMNPWCLQQLSGWPLAAGALSLCLVFCRWFFGFMAPPALLGLMSRVGAKEAQASACRNLTSCPQHKCCRGQRRKPVGSSLNKIQCCSCCKSPMSCIKSTALRAVSKMFATWWMSIVEKELLLDGLLYGKKSFLANIVFKYH